AGAGPRRRSVAVACPPAGVEPLGGASARVGPISHVESVWAFPPTWTWKASSLELNRNPSVQLLINSKRRRSGVDTGSALPGSANAPLRGSEPLASDPGADGGPPGTRSTSIRG